MTGKPEGKRILLATIGSLGDLHPMLALGLELQRRGHRVTVASTEHYRDKVLALGFGFAQMRPNWDPTDQELIAQCEELRTGFEVILRKLVLPFVSETYEDLRSAAEGMDLMLAGELVFAAPLVSEKLGLRWVSVMLSPISFLSAYDPSLLVNLPEAYRFRNAGWLVNRALLELGKLSVRHWWEPVRQLRREIGLREKCDPEFKDKFSPNLVLALFSAVLASKQPDWPAQTLQPGFVFYDGSNRERAEEETLKLQAFLDAGEAPIVFTLGSTAVHHPGNFYAASAAAAKRLGQRALLIGVDSEVSSERNGLLAVEYAPYSLVFPRAAVVVHQGGSGTTGQALRAGRPQLVVPYAWDQPDNGVRVERMGAGLCVARKDYSESCAAAAVERLLGDARFAENAGALGERVQREDALFVACEAIEKVLRPVDWPVS